MPDNLLCRLCSSRVTAWEFEVYGPTHGSGLLRVKCIECGFESTIRIFDKKHYARVLSQVLGEPMVFDFNGEW